MRKKRSPTRATESWGRAWEGAVEAPSQINKWRTAPTTSALPTGSPQPEARSPQPAPPRSERAFVFLIDDLGLDFGPVSGAKKAIAQWLNTKAVPADDVTILTTSGDLSWNDRVATGREDLLGIQLTGGGGGSRTRVRKRACERPYRFSPA